jgi:hypothetical protein
MPVEMTFTPRALTDYRKSAPMTTFGDLAPNEKFTRYRRFWNTVLTYLYFYG